MNHEVSVPLDQLEAAINYLEGLEVILRHLHEERRGVEDDDPLIAKLEALDFAVGEWSPLRYQDHIGTGWEFVAVNMAELRHDLAVRYGNASL